MRKVVPGEKISKQELDAFARMAGDSYVNDPVHAWVTKNESFRRTFVYHFMYERLHTSNGEDFFYIDDENRGVCVWRRARNEYGMFDLMRCTHWFYMMLYWPKAFKTLAAYSKLDVKRFPENCYIISPVFVAPEHQGKGIATQLIKEGIRDLTSLGYSLGLEAQSEKNVKFYESLGFKIFHEEYFAPGDIHHYLMMYEGTCE